MKFLRETLEQLSAAMQFANVSSLRELEALLESRESSAPAPLRRHAAGRIQHRKQGEGRTMDLSAFARRDALKPSGQS